MNEEKKAWHLETVCGQTVFERLLSSLICTLVKCLHLPVLLYCLIFVSGSLFFLLIHRYLKSAVTVHFWILSHNGMLFTLAKVVTVHAMTASFERCIISVRTADSVGDKLTWTSKGPCQISLWENTRPIRQCPWSWATMVCLFLLCLGWMCWNVNVFFHFYILFILQSISHWYFLLLYHINWRRRNQLRFAFVW